MGIIKTAVKVAAGTTVAQKALNIAYDTLSSDKLPSKGVTATKTTCYNCGKQIDAGVKFCPHCGASMAAAEDEYTEGYVETNSNSKMKDFDINSSSTRESQNTRTRAASICPNCGAKMDSFTHSCQYCGYEEFLEAPSCVKDLTNRLTSIESRRFVWHPKQKSALEGAIGMVLGKDEKEEEQRKAAFETFEKQKLNEKKLQILNYPVPNTPGEIMEFMLLAVSNINVQDGVIDEIEEAWISKMDQTYQRAFIVMQGNPNLGSIQGMYAQKMNEVYALKNKQANAKRNKKIFSFAIIGIGLFMIILGQFAGHASGDGNSPFYMVGILGMLVAMGGLFPLINNMNNKDK